MQPLPNAFRCERFPQGKSPLSTCACHHGADSMALSIIKHAPFIIMKPAPVAWPPRKEWMYSLNTESLEHVCINGPSRSKHLKNIVDISGKKKHNVICENIGQSATPFLKIQIVLICLQVLPYSAASCVSEVQHPCGGPRARRRWRRSGEYRIGVLN